MEKCTFHHLPFAGTGPDKIEYLLKRDLETIEHMALTEDEIKGYNTTRLIQPLFVKETIETIKKLQPELKK